MKRILESDEQEIWRRGPVDIYDEWSSLSAKNKLKFVLGNRKAANLKKVYYMLTNKRAIIVGAEKDEELIAQCSLSDCEIVIANMPTGYGQVPYGTQKVIPVGDMLFLANGNIALRFRKVEDPDSVLALIKTVAKGSY